MDTFLSTMLVVCVDIVYILFRYLVAGCSGGLIFMWELTNTGRLLHRLATSDGSAVLAVAFSVDGAQLAVACHSGAIQVFSVSNSDSLFVLTEHKVCWCHKSCI
jgi:WD40 repeat protein